MCFKLRNVKLSLEIVDIKHIKWRSTIKWGWSGGKIEKVKKRSNSCCLVRGVIFAGFSSPLTLILRFIDVNIKLSTLIMLKARETRWARENNVVRGQVFDSNNVDGFVGEFYERRAFCGLYRRLWDFRHSRSMMSSNLNNIHSTIIQCHHFIFIVLSSFKWYSITWYAYKLIYI